MPELKQLHSDIFPFSNSPSFCTSLISLDLIEPLLHLLSVSNVVSVLVGIWVPWVQDMVA